MLSHTIVQYKSQTSSKCSYLLKYVTKNSTSKYL